MKSKILNFFVKTKDTIKYLFGFPTDIKEEDKKEDEDG